MQALRKKYALQNGFGNMLFTAVEGVANGGTFVALKERGDYIDTYFKDLPREEIENAEDAEGYERDYFISLESAKKLPREEILSLLKEPEGVPVFKYVCHLRFGDYMMKWPYCMVKPTRRYVEDAAAALGIDYRELVFVSDTPQFARLILGTDITVYEGTELQQFWAMVKATEAVVMSPSTWSFWGTYLGNARRVVFPKFWAEDFREENYGGTMRHGVELLPEGERYICIDNLRRQRVGIVSINLGIYTKLWEDFHKSAVENLAVDCEREFFVVTDDGEMKVSPGVEKVLYKTSARWPEIMTEKFKIFQALRPRLMDFDYVFFFNANCLFTKKIYARDLGMESGRPMVAALHPGCATPEGTMQSLERNPKSAACVENPKVLYCMGGFNGGRPRYLLHAMAAMQDMKERDAESGFGLPKWHDESYWNRFINDFPGAFHILPSTFSSYYPSTKPLNFSEEAERVILRNKELIFGEGFREKLK